MNKNKKNRYPKQCVAIILLIAFGGTIVLTGIVALGWTLFFNKSEVSVSASNQPVDTYFPTTAPATLQPTQTPVSPLATANAAEGGSNRVEAPAELPPAQEYKGNEAPVKLPEGQPVAPAVDTPDSSEIRPAIHYTASGKKLTVMATVNSPDGTVYTLLLLLPGGAIISDKAPVGNGIATFSFDMPDQSAKQIGGFLQLDMTRDNQPQSAIDRYGSLGEKIKTIESTQTVKNPETNSNKFEYRFEIQYP